MQFRKSLVFHLALIASCLPLCLFLSSQPFSYAHTYLPRLSLWQKAVLSRNWATAYQLEKSLDPFDTKLFIATYYPQSVKAQITQLESQPKPTIETYIEIAKKYIWLSETDLAKKSLDKAIKLDPIREDLRQIRNEIN